MSAKIKVLMIDGAEIGKVVVDECGVDRFDVLIDRLRSLERVTYKLSDFVACGRVFRIGISDYLATPPDNGAIMRMILDASKIGFEPYKTLDLAHHELSSVEKHWWYEFALMQDRYRSVIAKG